MSASASYSSPRNPFAGAAPLAYRPLSAIAATAGGGVPQARIKRVLAELVAPVQALHDQGLVRGDISVHSVGLDETGRAHLMTSMPGYGPEPPALVLESGYAPPELYMAGPQWPRGPWTDIYALGAVAHSLVTGTRPPAAAERVAADRYRPLADRELPKYEPAFLHALDSALALDPRDRPQTLQEFVQLLDIPVSAVLAPVEPPLAPAPPAEPTVVDAGAARPGLRSLLLALLLLAVGAGVGVYWWHRLAGPGSSPVITWSGAAPPAVPARPEDGVWRSFGDAATQASASSPVASIDTGSPGTADPSGAARPAGVSPLPAGVGPAAQAPLSEQAAPAERPAPIASPVPWVRVKVDIRPWGEIWVDGVRRGVSPPLKEFRLPPGRHEVVIRNANLPPHRSTLMVREGQPTVLSHVFE